MIDITNYRRACPNQGYLSKLYFPWFAKSDGFASVAYLF